MSLSFLASLYLDGKRECDGDSDVLFFLHTHGLHPLTCRVQLTCITVAVSKPCNSNFGAFFNDFISVDYMFLYW